jgi:phenylalanyl-tRNA synthetase alpha chain
MDIEKTIKELSQNEIKVLLTLKKLNGKASPENILKNGDFNQEVEVMNASSWLQSKKLVKIEDHINTVYILGNEGKQFIKSGLPEKRALQLIFNKGGKASINELSSVLSKPEVPVAIGWLKKNGWASIIKEKTTIFEITDNGKKALKTDSEEEKILHFLNEKPNSEIEKNEIKSLLSRKNVVKVKEIITSTIVLTEDGINVLHKGIEIKDEISQITSKIIKKYKKSSIISYYHPAGATFKSKTSDSTINQYPPTGQTWLEEPVYRPYDINAFAPAIYGGKAHPLVDLISKIRKIFIEMGFEEIQGDFVESCFWNMDMLFIPQDHPAREMQDTLYCKVPLKINIKEKDVVEKIAKVHEDGGITSSTGWGYKFSKTEGGVISFQKLKGKDLF